MPRIDPRDSSAIIAIAKYLGASPSPWLIGNVTVWSFSLGISFFYWDFWIGALLSVSHTAVGILRANNCSSKEIAATPANGPDKVTVGNLRSHSPQGSLDYFRRSFPSRVVETCSASCASLVGAPPALPVPEHYLCFTFLRLERTFLSWILSHWFFPISSHRFP